MFFEPQEHKLTVLRLDDDPAAADDHHSRHGPLLPSSIRCIIAGPSNVGKTTAMVNLLTDENGLRFEHIYLYTKTPDQPKYIMLKKVMEGVDGAQMHVYTDGDHVPPPEQVQTNSVFVFDDVAFEKQRNIAEYFCRGRHNGIDSFYLTQTYVKAPKHGIRDNASMIVLYKQDETNVRHVYQEHCQSDMTFADFKSMCSQCWNTDRYSFLTIVKDFDLNDGRYRMGFDVYIKRRDGIAPVQ